MRPRWTPTLALALVLSLALTWALREIHNVRIGYPEAVPDDPAQWWCYDPDSQYHMRRLLRLFEEGAPVAETDPYLNHPHGALVPWPPYYTYFLAAVLGPFAPEEPEALRAYIERGVASVPAFLALLTALGAALAAAALARASAPPEPLELPRASARASAAAALVAGVHIAFFNGSVQYSAFGIGDHHAFVTAATAWMLAATAAGLARERRDSRRAGLAYGAAAGALSGLLLGAWAGGLMYVLLVQAVLGLLLFAHGRRAHRSLVTFGLGYHAAALAVLLPAVWTSPWKREFPWMVVNLSWFHAAELALGALVFAPLFWIESPGAGARRWPWIVAAALALGAAVGWMLDAGPIAGIREGFAWAGRSNEFMAFITESQPLLIGGRNRIGDFFKYLGYGVLLLPWAWALACSRGRRQGDARFAVWVAVTPVLLFQTLVQRRFADCLGPPFAVLLGWLAGELAAGRARPRLARAPLGLLLAGAALLAALANWRIAHDAYKILRAGQRWVGGPDAAYNRETRTQLEWLRAQPGAPPGAVLAPWEQGHFIEWGADRPSVGTNFGSYVGIDSYLDPWRFLLGEDPAAAEALLERRDARFVQVTSHVTRTVPTMIHLLAPGEDSSYYVMTPDSTSVQPRFYDTLAARLLLNGGHLDPEAKALAGPSLDFLRLVHVTDGAQAKVALPYAPPPYPFGFLWERVAGARLRARGSPGERLRVELEVQYDLERRAHTLAWYGEAEVGPDGRAEVRVPYATSAPNGIGQALGRARWTLGEASGRVDVPEQAVLEGLALEIR